MLVAAIRRYPVKSMLGEALPITTITSRGIPGDRALALLNRATGNVASTKHPRLWRRFRPNLVINPPATGGFVENDWVGRTLLIGDDSRLRVTDPTPRCVIPTLPHGDLPRDPGILRTIAAHNRPPIPTLGDIAWPSVGVYATVEQGGIVREGDAVQVVG